MRKSTMFAVEIDGGPNLNGNGNYLLYLSKHGTVSIEVSLFNTEQEARAAKDWYMKDGSVSRILRVDTVTTVID